MDEQELWSRAAIAAMQGIITHGVDSRFTKPADVAARAVEYADALMRARAKQLPR